MRFERLRRLAARGAIAGRRGSRGWAIVAACAVSLSAVVSPIDAAFSGHEYSYAGELSGSVFVGVHVSRTDVNYPNIPGTACTSYFTLSAHPIYETEWVIITSDAQNWEELGTADQCQGFAYMYWGYGGSSVWHPLGESATPGGGPHTFQILKTSSGYWNYWLDSSVKGSDYWPTTGARVEAGLESYADYTITAEAYQGLEAATSVGGGWHSWSGRDEQVVDSDMCGRWASDADWRAGEHSTC